MQVFISSMNLGELVWIAVNHVALDSGLTVSIFCLCLLLYLGIFEQHIQPVCQFPYVQKGNDNNAIIL